MEASAQEKQSILSALAEVRACVVRTCVVGKGAPRLCSPPCAAPVPERGAVTAIRRSLL